MAAMARSINFPVMKINGQWMLFAGFAKILCQKVRHVLDLMLLKLPKQMTLLVHYLVYRILLLVFTTCYVISYSAGK